MKSPKVTVLMPVYNGEKYLKEAIDSILNQDFKDFEFLIINDGSSDNSPKIISSYSDSRIRSVNNDQNLGLVNTLNKGLALSCGEYVVRMDCDDVSAKNRLSVQVKFMDNNKNIGASGSYYYLLRNDKKAVLDMPLSKEEIKCYMLFNCPIAHPTAIIRNSVVKNHQLNYSSEFKHSEDFDFWSRLSEHDGIVNLSEKLLNYRMHDSQITGNKSFASTRYNSVNTIRCRHLERFGMIPTEEELAIHNILSDGIAPKNEGEINAAEEWLKKLILHNNKTKALDKGYLEKIILERWLRLCFNFFQGKRAFWFFLNSDIYKAIHLPLALKLELLYSFYYSWKRQAIKIS